MKLPVDVPDEFGLGERLALIVWLKEHRIGIRDTEDITALRSAYLRLTRPPPADVIPDPARDEFQVLLWRRHSVNADPTASTEELRALLAQLDEQQRIQDATRQRDLERRDAESKRQRPVAPQPSTATPAPPTAANRASVAAPPLPEPAEEGWHHHTGEMAAMYRLHRSAMRTGFAAQGGAGKPWAAEALAYLDDCAADLTQGLASVALAAELSKQGSRLIAAGCDDPMVLYRHAVVGSHLNYRTNLKRAFDAMTGSAYPLMYRMSCAERLLKEYWYTKGEGPDGETTASVSAVWLDAVRQMLRSQTDEPLLRQQHARLLGRFEHEPYEWRRLELVEAEAHLGLMDPWLAQTLLGQVSIAKAWKSRGTGWAKSVSSDGWEGFSQHLEEARRHFEAAWEINQTLSMPADQMITVAMGLNEGRAELNRWFELAIKTSPENAQAWENRLYAAQSKWGGSRDELLMIGRRALDFGFDGEAPWFYLRALDMARGEHPSGAAELPILLKEEVWRDLSRLFEGYLAKPAWTRQRRHLVIRYASEAYHSGRYDSCRRILKDSGVKIEGVPFVKDEAVAQRMIFERQPTMSYVIRESGPDFYVLYDGPDEIWLPKPYRVMSLAEQEAARLNAAGAEQP